MSDAPITTTPPSPPKFSPPRMMKPEPAAARSEPTPTPPATCVKLRDFNAWYGDFHVLHGIGIDIPEKNVTAFIGPSGCGKSTLLRWFNRMNDTVADARAAGTLDMHELNVLSKGVDVVD